MLYEKGKGNMYKYFSILLSLKYSKVNASKNASQMNNTQLCWIEHKVNLHGIRNKVILQHEIKCDVIRTNIQQYVEFSQQHHVDVNVNWILFRVLSIRVTCNWHLYFKQKYTQKLPFISFFHKSKTKNK